MNLKPLNDLKSFLISKYSIENNNLSIHPEISPSNINEELTVNCFRLAQSLKINPELIAQTVFEYLSSHPAVTSAEKIKAFVNFSFNAAALYEDTLAHPDKIIADAKVSEKEKKHYLIEYSAPNTNKPLHLGHIRNNTLGMALTSLLKRVGHDVTAVNLINDRGIHICKSMIAYKKFGNGQTPTSTKKKGDHFVGDFYIKFDTELKKELRILKENNPELSNKSDEELFASTAIGSEAQEILRKWEAGDSEVISLWKIMNSWVVDGFEQTYNRMGIKFDKIYLESETYKLGKEIVLKGEREGIFTKREDGAIFADLKPFGLTEKVLLRPDTTSVYITQDIGTTLKKYEEFHPDCQIWVVGDEQLHHFKTLFAIIKLLGFSWADNLYHLSYGMINLPSGKMKSREGTVVDADNLFDDMHNLAKNATIERSEGKIPNEIEKKSEIIAQGALKFMLLKYNPKTTILFDPQASIKFEGDTGPYVQYVCARINSILKKAPIIDFNKINWAVLETKWEKALAVLSAFYPSTLLTAAEKLDCSVLVNYLLDLAKAYNCFYRECSVLSAKTQELKEARIALSSAIKEIIEDGLKTLTIEVPETM